MASVFAAPKVAMPSAPTSGGWATRRFEISIQGGGVVGGNWGNGNYGHCFSSLTAPNGCEPNQVLTETLQSIGVYNGQIGGIRRFQSAGGLNPGNGPALGARIGWNFNPQWEFEVIYNHTWQPMSFSNQMLGDRAIEEFVLNSGFSGSNQRVHNIRFLDKDTGRPRGDQNMWLFNLNRNFNAGNRLVPYIGGGVGFVNWYAAPKLNLVTETQGRGNTRAAEITKYGGRGDGFAFDIAAGAKWYWTQHLGARFDFTDVISFPEITNVAQTRDLTDLRGTGAGALLPITGASRQNGRFNQAMFTGGLFWAFGHEMTSPSTRHAIGDRDSLHDHWELSWTLGGVWGSTLSSGVGHCTGETGLATDGCDITQDFNHTSGVSVFPGRIAFILPEFMARRTVRPGNGWITGGRIGYKFTPSWEFDFIYNYSGAPTELENKPILDHAEEFFYGFNETCTLPNCLPKTLNFLHGWDGRPQGNQSQLLFNVQYNVHPQKRFVPYLAAGLGAEIWNGNPHVLLETTTTAPISASRGERIAWFSKTIPSATGFAFDIATGAKYYMSRHWGFRTDITNVWSFQDFNAKFATIDTSGHQGTPGAHLPVSGKITKSGTANQLSAEAGLFMTF